MKIAQGPYLYVQRLIFVTFFYKLVNLVLFSLQLSLHRKAVFIPTGRQKYVLTQRQVFSCFQIFASISSSSHPGQSITCRYVLQKFQVLMIQAFHLSFIFHFYPLNVPELEIFFYQLLKFTGCDIDLLRSRPCNQECIVTPYFINQGNIQWMSSIYET